MGGVPWSVVRGPSAAGGQVVIRRVRGPWSVIYAAGCGGRGRLKSPRGDGGALDGDFADFAGGEFEWLTRL